jgi:DNA mismatch repair protein MutL
MDRGSEEAAGGAAMSGTGGTGEARTPIRRLDAETVALIAAGEVVERPASVVKELVENAYDAGAREVRVALGGGGIDRIAVADDGWGIPEGELSLAVERHATSKLPDGRLDAILTLGFRGEALASIGSVSRLSILSRTRGADEAHGIRVEGGRVTGTFVQGAPPGTTVEVRDLFFNTPARRKFLRSAPSEQVDVVGVAGALHLARPSVTLLLESEGRELARYPRTERLKDAVIRVLGPELIDQTFEVDAPDQEGVAFRAVLGRPAVSRGTPQGLFLSVNGRPVASRPLATAVRLAFDDYLPRTRYPMGSVHLTIDPSRVDVNVHPTKREVRLARERDVAERLRREVRSALVRAPQAADRGGAAAPFSRPRLPSVEVPPAGPAEPVPLRFALPPSDRTAAQRILTEAAEPRAVASSTGHPPVTLHACLFRLYWVGESEDALVVVDQHAASERVVYEALRQDGRLARQELVSPVTLRLTARQASLLEARQAEIAAAGYLVEPFGGGAWRVGAVPVYRGRLARAELLPALLDELADGGRPTVPNGLAERTCATIACHAAVRAGDVISAEEMGRILEALYRLPEAAYACPHGRPILVRLPRGRLDRWFLRSGD